MISRPRNIARHRLVRGFSLLELMVGLAIGMVLVAGLALMFANTSLSGRELNKSVEQIENGRYAMDLLTEDFQHAGFYGELAPDSLAYSTPSACETTLASLGWDKTTPATPTVPVPIMGLSSTEAAALAASCLPNHKSGTPAFVIHRLDAQAVLPADVTAGTVYVQNSRRCTTDAPSNQPFVISDKKDDFTLKSFKCDTTVPVRRYLSRVYFVADCNECGQDQTPTLKMAELRGNQMVVVPLTEGIEDLGIEYGFDTATPPSGSATEFLTELSGTAGAADNVWNNVVAVRLHLLTRAVEPTPGFDDGGKTYDLGSGSTKQFTDHYKRRVYTTTVRLTNVAGPREATPLPVSP